MINSFNKIEPTPTKIEPTPTKIKMKKIKAKKRTIEEFKNWLEGLQEFQNDGWSPSKEQWELIKAGISAIKEHPVKVQPTTLRSNNNVQTRIYEQPIVSSLDDVPPTIQNHIRPQNIDPVGHVDVATSTSTVGYTSEYE